MNDSLLLIILQMMFIYGAYIWTIPWYITWMPTILLFTLGIIILILAIIATVKKTKEINKKKEEE